MDTQDNTIRPQAAGLLRPCHRKLIFAVLALAAGGIVCLQLLRPNGISASAGQSGKPAQGAGKPLEIEQIRGICMTLHNGCDTHPYDKYIREIAATGANAICITVTAYQQNCGSSSIFLEARRTQPERRLNEMLSLCHELGLKVILMPIVLLENARTDEWRGKIDPTMDKNTWEDWWEDYGNYILYYATIAEANKVDIFMVGSELLSTEGQVENWGPLIDQVRGVYKGYLSYSSNWDHYTAVKFWDKLDIIGMTSYYDLCGSKEPTAEVLNESSLKIKKDLLEWQCKQGKPLLLTEVGWPNQATAAAQPWNYYGAADKPDPELQKRCFEAFFNAWADEPALGGYLVWEWRCGDWPTAPGEDTSYCPMDKPSMEAIKKDFLRPNGKPGASQSGAIFRPATQAATSPSEQESP